MNLDVVLPHVFKMQNLCRLDLSFNNLVRLDPAIGDLTNLTILWLNDNPLREVPIEISKCHKLKELDLKNLGMALDFLYHTWFQFANLIHFGT